MAKDVLSEILSSPNSLGIAALVSIRPRTQSELAELSGVSVPAVLKHLKRLEALGLVQENKLTKDDRRIFAVRGVYCSREFLVGDFSRPNFRIVRLLKRPDTPTPSGEPILHLESLAEDLILQKRRIAEQVRKLERMIDDMLEDQARLTKVAEVTGRGLPDRLILETIFTEESLAEGERVLARHYGLKEGRRSIDGVLAESRKIAKK